MEKQANPNLNEQIREYKKVFNNYQDYATTLNDYFEKSCEHNVPHAIVQTRVKTLSSFAEKAIRKHKEYPDPIHQFGDLCGARIIVHTSEQVNWVNEFIERNFEVIEKEDVQKRLGENQFGYLSIHYIVNIKPNHDYGISKEMQKAITGRKAEVQVRTILQHAWSDILHDRLYKNKITLPEDVKRSSALLAALMEEGDERYARVTERTDNLFLNYSAYMTKEEISEEIITLTQLLEFEPEDKKKPAAALKLAKLTALADQDYEKVINQLKPYQNTNCSEKPYILLELGLAYCKVNRNKPTSKDYKKGQKFINDVLNACNEGGCLDVVDQRKLNALIALAYARLAWSNEAFSAKLNKTIDQYHEALKNDPSNPYYLSESLGFCVSKNKDAEILPEMHLLINDAIQTCTQHARAGMELPQAHFTRGRLCLLKGEFERAYGFYARGIQHFLDEKQFSPNDALVREELWLNLLSLPDENKEINHIRTLLLLGKTIHGDKEAKKELIKISADRPIPKIKGNVLIIAGGAADMNSADKPTARRLLEIALQNFEGTIISGGTSAGIPGMVGEVVKKLKATGNKIHLMGYLPAMLPTDIPKSPDYDEIIRCKGEKFSVDELHHSWIDLIRSKIDPKSVKLLGINGGIISAIEYRLAITLGAITGIVLKTGREADALSSDADWNNVSNLMFIPNDPASISLFISRKDLPFDQEKLEELSMLVHEQYLTDRIKDDPDKSLKFWTDLPETLKNSNRAQVIFSVFNLNKAGFGVRKVENPDPKSVEFSKEEIELLAELEHGRWNAERLLDGWRWGTVKNVSKKINPSLVPWSELPDSTKKWDRVAVNKFPALLALAGLEVFKQKDQKKIYDQTKAMLATKIEFLKEIK